MVVKLYSRLGNQMFMYAFGQGLGKEVRYYFEDEQAEYELLPYTHVPLLAKEEIKEHKQYVERGFRFNPQVFSQPANTMFEGCWQTEKYFAHVGDNIRAAFTLKNVPPELAEQAEQLRNCNSVAVGVRRGDNLEPEKALYHGSLSTTDYYRKAYAYICERVPGAQFFVFSDDPDWCEKNMEGTIMRGNKYEDLHLFSQCRHAIIANSTFHWWGAWLGEKPSSIIVAPHKWFNQAPLDYSDVVPDRWVKL